MSFIILGTHPTFSNDQLSARLRQPLTNPFGNLSDAVAVTDPRLKLPAKLHCRSW